MPQFTGATVPEQPAPPKRVTPNAHSGRAQRAGGHSCRVRSRSELPIPARHGRTSRTVAHGNVSCVCSSLLLVSTIRVPRLTGPTVPDQPALSKWVAPDAIRGCRRQQETVSETVPQGNTSPTCPAVRTPPRWPPATHRTNFTP